MMLDLVKETTTINICTPGLCFVMSKWAMDIHCVLLNDEQMRNKVGVEHQSNHSKSYVFPQNLQSFALSGGCAPLFWTNKTCLPFVRVWNAQWFIIESIVICFVTMTGMSTNISSMRGCALLLLLGLHTWAMKNAWLLRWHKGLYYPVLCGL